MTGLAPEVDAAVARLVRWGAESVGAPWRTPSSVLVPGMRDGVPVVLKVPSVEEERLATRLLVWWDGRGAVPVLEHDDGAVLMVRATGPRDLAAMARTGRDAEATAVLVDAVSALHAHGLPPADVPLVPLRRWFRDLLDHPQPDPLLAGAAEVALGVLAATTDADVVALHGDVHHGNVLDLGDGWGAIDPKGLIGHRAFDVANLFCNPDQDVAAVRLEDRLVAVAERFALDPDLLVRWVVAWCGLSTAWVRQDPSAGRRTPAEVLARLLPRC